MRLLRSRITMFALAAAAIACGDRTPSAPADPASGERQTTGKDTSHAKPDTTHTPPDTTHTPPDSSHLPPPTKRIVSGTVLGVQGTDSTQANQPVANVTITATVSMVVFDSTTAHHDSTIVTRTLGTTTTDAAGRFSLSDMPTSGFSLTATPPSDSPYRSGTAYVFPAPNVYPSMYLPTTVTVILYRK